MYQQEDNKIANVTIVDTGYANVESTGTREVLIANLGFPIELKGVSMTYNIGMNLDNAALPGVYDNTEVNVGSINGETISISASISKNDDLTFLGYFRDLVKSRGIKCIYYNDAETGIVGYPLITKYLGSLGGDALQHPDEKHFHARFTSFQITQGVRNLYTYTLTGVMTK